MENNSHGTGLSSGTHFLKTCGGIPSGRTDLLNKIIYITLQIKRKFITKNLKILTKYLTNNKINIKYHVITIFIKQYMIVNKSFACIYTTKQRIYQWTAIGKTLLGFNFFPPLLLKKYFFKYFLKESEDITRRGFHLRNIKLERWR